ncbi:MAG TPA: allophanate hydrolase subunit 1 [Nocardioidaceae bacterium]|nr:allophanate hydrolase subunit 1 [Nocardioidaceae bacterium]
MRLLPVGAAAVLVEVESTDEAMALYEAARASGFAARDIVPAARTVLFDGVEPSAVASFVASGVDLSAVAAEGALVEIRTVYDGPDLANTAELLEMTPDELVARHTATTFTVAFCGFAPGFAYCTGLGHSVPRLDSPRPRVEPGSVGLAGEFTGIYPSPSPGGWRLIGRTDAVLWDPERVSPALLSPGSRVRFVTRGG